MLRDDEPESDEVGRHYAYFDRLDNLHDSSYGEGWPEGPYDRATKSTANLLSSLCDDGTHRPVIDFDIPMRLIPSTTPGNGHLYIDKPLAWKDYKKLLKTLFELGLIQKGFYDFSIMRKQTYVRPAWIKKVTKAELKSKENLDEALKMWDKVKYSK